MTEPARVGPGRDHRFDLAVVATVIAIALTALVLQTGDDRFQRNISDILEIIAPMIAVVVAVHATRRADGRGWRVGWMMIGASCASWAIGQVIWTWFEIVKGETTPFPSPADFFYLFAIPLAVGGLLAMPSSSDERADRARVVLDGTIAAAAVLFVSWVTVLGPTLQTSSGTWLERAISLAYPAGDVIILTMVIVAFSRSDQAGQIAIGFTGLGFAAFALADSLFVYTSNQSGPVSNVSNDAWVAGYLLIALGAYHASRHPPARVSALSRPYRGRGAMVLLPYIPVAVVLGICIGVAIRNDPIVVGDAPFAIGTVLIVLLLVRQGFVILENSRLTRSLGKSNERLQYQLLHDNLTGLPNRPLFLDRLRVALARLDRLSALAVVMFVDLDLFKLANDTYGHETGDEVLIAVGRRLTRSVRAGDTVARFGGDEFLVLCEGVRDLDEANLLARRMASAITEPIRFGDIEIQVHASVGLVVTDDPATVAETMVSDADGAMYQAKRNGRDRVEVVDSRLHTIGVG